MRPGCFPSPTFRGLRTRRGNKLRQGHFRPPELLNPPNDELDRPLLKPPLVFGAVYVLFGVVVVVFPPLKGTLGLLGAC